ncbi:hypothetical protein ACLOJK_033986 [Asimina triloba]
MPALAPQASTMSGDLRLLSLAHHQDLNHSSSPSGALMWNTHRTAATATGNEDDSWEVRAFAEDTGGVMGTTWPPRSYTCTFCRREFRSAQALGGHMNVHRRDRARLRQSMPEPSPAASASPLVFPTQEFVAGGGGLCLLYAFPPHGNAFSSPAAANGYNLESPSTHLSMAHSASRTANKATTTFGFPAAMDVETKALPNSGGDRKKTKSNQLLEEQPMAEELDLELRLGQRLP